MNNIHANKLTRILILEKIENIITARDRIIELF